MTLLNSTTQVFGKFDKFFDTIRSGTAPDKFTREHLKDIGFTGSNFRAMIPLLKGLGFLSSDGSPTERYRAYLDETRSKTVMGEAVKEAYSDIFVIRSNPSQADKAIIQGKFKSTFNLSDVVASRAANTFLSLVELSDYEVAEQSEGNGKDDNLSETDSPNVETPDPESANSKPNTNVVDPIKLNKLEMRYNIQIHLPATKDIEVYNSIFKSIREHLID